jgi:predicted transcriptional regulator
VNVSEWQTEEIRRALTEAERGEFASDEQVRSVMKKRTAHKGTRHARYAAYVFR